MDTFDHERLDAYAVSRAASIELHRCSRKLPRGNANLGDQLRRAATSVTLNVAEGAGEFAPDEKARF